LFLFAPTAAAMRPGWDILRAIFDLWRCAGESFGDVRTSHIRADNSVRHDLGVVMEFVYAAVIVAAVLIFTCSVIVLRRRGRSRG
jgi:hypothetical protein